MDRGAIGGAGDRDSLRTGKASAVRCNDRSLKHLERRSYHITAYFVSLFFMTAKSCSAVVIS